MSSLNVLSIMYVEAGNERTCGGIYIFFMQRRIRINQAAKKSPPRYVRVRTHARICTASHPYRSSRPHDRLRDRCVTHAQTNKRTGSVLPLPPALFGVDHACKIIFRAIKIPRPSGIPEGTSRGIDMSYVDYGKYSRYVKKCEKKWT